MKSKTMKLKTSALLKGLRLELGLTQTEFAKRVGKPQSTIARIETGTVIPTIKLLREIATKADKRLEISFVEKV
jgi:predicted transcriptional regulator